MGSGTCGARQSEHPSALDCAQLHVASIPASNRRPRSRASTSPRSIQNMQGRNLNAQAATLDVVPRLFFGT
jgi:hypothetical protein